MSMYAVVFDNDKKKPGKLQFCHIHGSPETKITKKFNANIHAASATVKDLKRIYPALNYRVVKVTLEEVATEDVFVWPEIPDEL